MNSLNAIYYTLSHTRTVHTHGARACTRTRSYQVFTGQGCVHGEEVSAGVWVRVNQDRFTGGLHGVSM